MKITKRQLQRIIREEKARILKEARYSDEFTHEDQLSAEDDARTEEYLDWIYEQLAPKAGDILAKAEGERGMLPSDLFSVVRQLIKELASNDKCSR